ncbi:MAG: sigma-E processing peptidase SpoIIGA [Lachnospiraceae bacterium]|nr:sigma-E processing peptidase SpoIIGA [Lachnospiraceae bacterium]
MTIYLDVVFFMNLLYQLGILIITDFLLHMHVSKWRIFAGAVLGSAGYCVCIVTKIPMDIFPANLIAGAVIGIFSVLAAFYPAGRKKLGGLIVTEFFLAVCLGGILELIPGTEKESYLLLTASGAIVFMAVFCIKVKKLIFEKMKDEKSIRKVRLYHKGRSAETHGLIDTGNGLTDPISKEPVIILQKSLREVLLLQEEVKEQKGYRLIPYGSIGRKNGVLEAFRLEKLEIWKEEKNGKEEVIIRSQVMCAVYEENYSTKGSYEVILHPLLL